MDDVDRFAMKQGIVILLGIMVWLLSSFIIARWGYSRTMAAFIAPLFLSLEVFIIGNILIRLKKKVS